MAVPLPRILSFFGAVLIVGMPAYGLLIGLLNRNSRLEAAMWCSPIIAVALSIAYRLHLPMLLLAFIMPLNLPQIVVPRLIPVSLIMPFFVFAGLLLRTMMGRTASRPTDKRIDVAMYITSGMTIVWLLVNRPGLGSLGSDTGGAWEGMLAFSAALAYWGVRGLRDIAFDWKRMSLWILFGSMASVIWTTISAILTGMPLATIYSGLFTPRSWWLFGFALGITTKVYDKQGSVHWRAYVVAAVLLTSSLVSGFRSRILCAPLMVAVAFGSARMKKLMGVSILAFVALCMLLANSDIYNDLPFPVQRVLSIVRTERQVAATVAPSESSGELGWRSPWRMLIWRIAWTEVKKDPFFGHGYGFNNALLMADQASVRGKTNAVTRGVTAAGQFHNLPLSLMYFWGIPGAVMYSLAWILTLRHLISLSLRSESWFGAFVVGVTAYSAAATVQALINGSGTEHLLLSMIMGLTQLLRAAEPCVSVSPSLAKEDTRTAKQPDAVIT